MKLATLLDIISHKR